MKNLERYKRSIKSEALSSVLLLICTISALCIANSSYEGIYNKIIFDNLFFRFPLNEFINDFLMFFFFLNVGLEIKEYLIWKFIFYKEGIFSSYRFNRWGHRPRDNIFDFQF